MPSKKTIILAIVLLPIVLSSCNQQSETVGSSRKQEIINGIIVPPEPDTKNNNATLAGVDSNNNGVRDDVERSIAKKVKDLTSFNQKISIAKEYQAIITGSMSGNTITEASKRIACLTIKDTDNSMSNVDIGKIVMNTPEKLNIFKRKTIDASGFALDVENDCK